MLKVFNCVFKNFEPLKSVISTSIRNFHCLSPVNNVETLLKNFEPLKSVTSMSVRNFHLSPVNNGETLAWMHKRGGPPRRRPPTKKPIKGAPHYRGVVLQVMIMHPKKPSSGNRKVVRVRLTTGQVVRAWVPGERHNLQEHSVVLVEGGTKKDLQGIHCRVIRGKYDCNKPTPEKKPTANA